MNSETVDLIYVDPSFDPDANYADLSRRRSNKGDFMNKWTLKEVDAGWINLVEIKYPNLYYALLEVEEDKHKAYIAYVAARLFEAYRLLKPTGSICLHCKPATFHNLRLAMDAICGQDRFKEEIAWRYPNDEMQRLGPSEEYDALLIYGKGPDRLTRDYQHTEVARNEEEKILDQWEIPPVLHDSERSLDDPGQKPLALLKRIICNYSDEKDMVLDPFCGCATTLEAAERLDREWVGIDISPKTLELATRRLNGKTVDRIFESRTSTPTRTDIDNLPPDRKENLVRLYGEQNGTCAECRRTIDLYRLEIVHFIPKRMGGTDEIDNLQLLCASCNYNKHQRDACKGARGLKAHHSYLWLKLQLEMRSDSESFSKAVEVRDEQSIRGGTPLHGAVATGDPNVVRTLLEADADPDVLDDEDVTPLNSAVMFGELEIIEILLEEGADPDLPEISGMTPLHNIAMSGKPSEAIKLLLDAEADLEARNNGGGTPLHTAGLHKRPEIAQKLLEAGANPNSKNNEGWTPLHIAATVESLEIVKALLERRARPNARTDSKLTPLHLAAESEQSEPEIIELLLAHGAKADARNKSGKTPLHVAARSSRGKPEIIRLLVEGGADPNKRDARRRTPLILAAMSGNGKPEIIESLLDVGANPGLASDSGEYPVDYAQRDPALREDPVYRRLQSAVSSDG